MQLGDDPVGSEAVEQLRHGGQRVQEHRLWVGRHVALERGEHEGTELRNVLGGFLISQNSRKTPTWKFARSCCDLLSRSASTMTSDSLWTMTSKGP